MIGAGRCMSCASPAATEYPWSESSSSAVCRCPLLCARARGVRGMVFLMVVVGPVNVRTVLNLDCPMIGVYGAYLRRRS